MFVWMIGSSETVSDAFDTSEAKKTLIIDHKSC